MSLVYEESTSKSLEEAIASLKDNLKEVSFGVLWELNFKKTLESKGLDFAEDYVVLEVCNPKKAKAILEEDMQAGYSLPCKMAVRREKDKTYIGLSSPVASLGFLNNSKLLEHASEVEEILKKVIKASL